MARARHSVFGAMFIMIIVSILLFWLPVIGPLIAGFAGGKKAVAYSMRFWRYFYRPY